MIFTSGLYPSSLTGSLITGIAASLIASFIAGFFTGKHHEHNNIIKLRDNSGVVIQDSIVSGGNDGKIED